MSTSQSADPMQGRRQMQQREQTMVDRASLEVLGFLLGGVTAVVIAIAAIVVSSHVATDRVALDGNVPVIPASLSSR